MEHNADGAKRWSDSVCVFDASSTFVQRKIRALNDSFCLGKVRHSIEQDQNVPMV